jgi:D-3-phosphoglycerate dehydrogenase / 2-oxoglutarate reductase
LSNYYDVALVDYDPVPFEITPAIQQGMARRMAEVGANLRLAQCRTPEAVLEFARAADLVMIQSVRPLLDRAVIDQLACRAIIRMGLGYDSVDVVAASERGVLVSNVVDWCNDEVADHAAALILAGLRRLGPMDRAMHRGAWDRQPGMQIVRLRGKTLGILGFGRIGQALALRMAAFGLELIASDPYLDAAAAQRLGVTPVAFDELLARSDVVSVHARLVPETRHLLGAAEFARMKPGALLVNTARGPIVNEAALAAALQAGQLGGAALDVMESEPLPPDSPLVKMENVLLTPHLASFSREASAQLYQMSADIATHLLQNRWVTTIVNPQARPLAETRFGLFH